MGEIMCDVIIMPDGTEIESIVDNECLCGSTQHEILMWIVHHLPEIEIDTTVEITHAPFGWIVNILEVE